MYMPDVFHWDLPNTYTQPCYCCSQSAYNSADACLDEAETAALSLGGLPALSGCFAIQSAQTESR